MENVIIRMCGHLSSCSPLRHGQSTLAYLAKELVRWDEERVLPEQPADNDKWVRPHDVHRHARADFGYIVVTDHGSVVLRKNMIETRLVLQQVVHGWLI